MAFDGLTRKDLQADVRRMLIAEQVQISSITPGEYALQVVITDAGRSKDLFKLTHDCRNDATPALRDGFNFSGSCR